ncbi:helix-turn-helix transcriptional regulator [Fibrella aestuarina]|uniref:helix-turn-helix transcriptional regulator n=1 Tax=Fibrella aestuarina TaxID=651143 RepID=UPI00059C524D|nr:helix-turn-helix transcriptional regulator [Fibrella aestuarina]
MSINDKIKQVLTIKQLSPSQLADDIGVQRSSISHILSGRNRPSLDIIQKIVRCYADLSYEWFLEDDSQLSIPEQREERHEPTKPAAQPSVNRPSAWNREPTPPQSTLVDSLKKTIVPEKESPPVADKQVDRILIFYTDGTFREYRPA